MTHWAIGDLMVCVDDGPVKIIDGLPETDAQAVANLRKGRVCRITVIARGKTAKDVIGLGDHSHRAGGVSTRFRKIVKADSDFIEQMRAIKPKADA